MWHAKSVCRPSSREMSSFENVRPGIRPRFLSQKIAQNEPEKKMPSTHANATRRCAKLRSLHAGGGHRHGVRCGSALGARGAPRMQGV
jgi:hypothetical protein